MSYCRVGPDSDVYVIATWHPENRQHDALECFCGPPRTFTTARSGMIIHLLEHQALGDKVPARAFERLKREIREQGDEL